MIKISSALSEIISTNSLVQFGISNKLFNLTKLTNYLKPLVEVRTKKEITSASLLMELSRQQRKFGKIVKDRQDFKIESLNIMTGLTILTYLKNETIHKEVSRLYLDAMKYNYHMTINEGSREIMLIIDSNIYSSFDKRIQTKPKDIETDISGVSIKFSPEYASVPGFIHAVLQQLVIQGINIAEISSTYSELIIYVEKKDTKITFETIFNCFQY